MARKEGVTDQQLRDAAVELLDSGRALAWLERARLCVMAGNADYTGGYENVRALVRASREARAAYDVALASAVELLEAPADLEKLSQEQLAQRIPLMLEAALAPVKPMPPQPAKDAVPPEVPENPMG